MGEISREQLREKVLYYGMSISKAKIKYPYATLEDIDVLQKCRLEYLRENTEIKENRINFYIHGSQNSGKTTISRALALALRGNGLTKKESDVSYKVGMYGLDNYDGQSVIIWDDFSPEEFKKFTGGYSGALQLLGRTDDESIGINNRINIITSTIKLIDYVTRLAGKEGDIKQVKVRIHFFLDLDSIKEEGKEIYQFGRLDGTNYKVTKIEKFYIDNIADLEGNRVTMKIIKDRYIELAEKFCL